MSNFDDYTNENKTNHNPKWPYILDHPYRILVIGSSGSGKTNALLNLINNQPDIDILLHKDPLHKDKFYQYLAVCLLNLIMRSFFVIQNYL